MIGFFIAIGIYLCVAFLILLHSGMFKKSSGGIEELLKLLVLMVAFAWPVLIPFFIYEHIKKKFKSKPDA